MNHKFSWLCLCAIVLGTSSMAIATGPVQAAARQQAVGQQATGSSQPTVQADQGKHKHKHCHHCHHHHHHNTAQKTAQVTKTEMTKTMMKK